MAIRRCISKSLSISRKRAALHSVAGKLAEFCQALYPLLVVHVDDFGRLSGDAITVKALVDPMSPRSQADFTRALGALHSVGLIHLFSANDVEIVQIVKFDEHQTGLHKRTASQFPEFPRETPEVPGTSRTFPEVPPEEKGIEGKGRELNRTEQKRTAPASLTIASHQSRVRARFEAFWAAYPKKTGKDAAWRAWQKRRGADLADAIMTALTWQVQQDGWTKDNGQYVPNPATWLNQGRWLDEPQQPAVRRTAAPTACIHRHQPPCADDAVCTQRYLRKLSGEPAASLSAVGVSA